MNLPTIEMERPAAIRAFEEYRAAVRDRHQAEDAQLMAGYRALAAGHRLIDLPRAMREAGTVEAKQQGRTVNLPKLAICRADATMCFVDMQWDGGAWFAPAQRGQRPAGPRIRSGVSTDYVVLPRDTFPGHNNPSARAIVPIIPPGLRPARGLAGYHILWEAEWTLTAPVDPALLKHIGGDLWAVIATWDLTPLEQAVVMGRLR